MKASQFTDAQKAFIIKQGEDGVPLDSGAKCNGLMRSGFERLCQARRGWPGRVF